MPVLGKARIWTEVGEWQMSKNSSMAQESKYVVFRLGSQRFGLPIESVERILPVQPVTPMPKSPEMFLGLFDLRGSTIPVVDARLRLGMEAGAEVKNFVVVLTPEGRCALRVDEVVGISNFTMEQVEWEGVLIESRKDAFFKGIGKREKELTLILDPAHLIPVSLRANVFAAA